MGPCVHHYTNCPKFVSILRWDLSVWVVCLGYLHCPTMKCSINLSPITVCRKMSHERTCNYVQVWIVLHFIK